MNLKDIDKQELGITLAATAIAGRGIWEAFVLIFKTNNPSNSFLFSLILMISVSGILFLIGRSLKQRTKTGWQAGVTATFVLATTNLIYTGFGYSQPLYEYLIDAMLIAYLMTNRQLFFHEKVKTIGEIMKIK